MQIPQVYKNKIKNRDLIQFVRGLIPRLFIYIKFAFFRFIARKRGALIGKNTNLNWQLARMANANLIVGDDCIIESGKFDLRGKIIVHNHVIINKCVHVIRVSHNIDDDSQFSTKYYPDLHIGSYSWIATGTKILPQVTSIGEGAVCGAFSVISKNCEEDTIYVGNPGKAVRKHSTRFTDLVVCSLQGGDFNYYKKARKK